MNLNFKKFLLGRSLAYFYLWIGIAIPYLTWRGLDIQQAYLVISFYSLMNVILEYPTGVIGDVYGHKLSTATGNVFIALGILLTSFTGSFYYYFFTVFIIAIGGSLESGSDVALLKSISKNFKKDLRNFKTFGIFILFLASVVAGYVGQLNLVWPLYITLVVNLIAALFIISIDDSEFTGNDIKGNVFSKAGESLRYVKSSILVFGVIIFLGWMQAYLSTTKTFFNSFTEILNIDVLWIGWIVGIGLLLRSVGYKVEKYFEWLKTRYIITLIIFFLISSSLLTFSPIALIGSLYIVNILTGMVLIRYEYRLNELVPDNIRASILSLKNLAYRLFTSLYLLMAGYVLGMFSLSVFLQLTTLLFFIFTFIFSLISRSKRVNKFK